uniref:Uncharacterized protein n=1 Tax=Desulfobacca acetoxidans TaxID=60893 RepID=A0A7C3WQB6_9BACT
MERTGIIGIDEILKSPGRIECQALRANISTRQCAINQAQAKIDPYGPLQHCLQCQHPKRSQNRVKIKAGSRSYNYGPRSRALRAAAARGEVEKPRIMSLAERLLHLRDLSARAGWSTKRIDLRLRAINDAAPQEKRTILHKWAQELGGQT